MKDKIGFIQIAVDLETIKDWNVPPELSEKLAKTVEQLVGNLLFLGSPSLGPSTGELVGSYSLSEPIQIKYKPDPPKAILPEIRETLSAITPESIESALAVFLDHSHNWKAADFSGFRLACVICGKEISMMEFHLLSKT